MAAMGTGKTQAGQRTASLTALALGLVAGSVLAQPPSLDAIFPAGGQAGQVVNVTVHGARLEGLTELRCSVPGSRCETLKDGAARLSLPEATAPGLYDVWGIGPNGISESRSFMVGNQPEQHEIGPNQTPETAPRVTLSTVINGRIDGPEPDWFRFEARQGERVVIECWAERIDSTLRAILEVTDAAGRRLAINRGYFGIDPAIVLNVPADGEYLVRLQDLVGAGSPQHVYRLSIGTAPRVLFTMPNAVQRGTASRIALYGWNLPNGVPQDGKLAGLERLDVDIAGDAAVAGPLPMLLHPSQAALADAAMAYLLPGSATPVMFGVTDAPVTIENAGNGVEAPQDIAIPTEVCGQLIAGDESDWYAIRAPRGEVLHLAAYGERLGSPVDLQLAVCDEAGHELATFTDETSNLGGVFATSHLDPSGRWVVPADGRYLISVRNLTGGVSADPRRTYRLSVQRESPDFHVVVRPQGESPTGLNLQRGGRLALEALAIRERGMTGAIRITACDLPVGIECPDVWLGPGVSRGLLVVSTDDAPSASIADLRFEATADDDRLSQPQPIRLGTIVRGGTPGGRGRLTVQLPLAIAGEAPVRITARADEPLEHHLYGELRVRHTPGSILDVHVEVARRDSTHAAPVRLFGIGLPEAIETPTAIIPAGEHSGWVSFRLPATLPVGPYSLAIAAESTASVGGKVEPVRVASNPVMFRVEPAAIHVEIDPFAVRRVRRGEVFQLAYSAKRLNGFIGKMHTELATPGRVTDIPGLRGRGETFVSQTDSGSLQITVNDDAALGPQQFLRLFTVGVVEDQPTFFGSCFVPLEIVE